MAYERLDKTYKDGAIWDGKAVTHIDNAIEELDSAIANLNTSVSDINEYINESFIEEFIVNNSDYSIVGFCRPAGTFGTNTGYHRTDYIDVSQYISLKIHSFPSATVSPVVWFDSSMTYLSGEYLDTEVEGDFEYEVPDGAAYAIFSTRDKATYKSVYGKRKLAFNESIVSQAIATSADYTIEGFCRPAGTFGANSSYRRTDYIDISNCISVTVNWYANGSTVSPVVWFDESLVCISGAEVEDAAEQNIGTFTKPAGAVYAVFSTMYKGTYNVRGSVIETIEVGGGNSEDSTISFDGVQIATAENYSIVGFNRPAGTFSTNTGYHRTDYIDISNCVELLVHCYPKSTSVAPVVYYDENKTYITGITAASLDEGDFTYIVPANAKYAIFSTTDKYTSLSVIAKKEMTIPDYLMELRNSTNYKVYISPIGSDDNDGLTTSTPVATYERVKELLDPKGELVFMDGDYENFNLCLSDFSKVSTVSNKTRLIYYKNKLTSGTLVDGYTRVYSVPLSKACSGFLWQHDIPDEETLIVPTEKHPLQRGRTHRLTSTRIYPATQFDTTSTTTDGFIASIESMANKYLYYYDSTNAVLYYSAPNSDFLTYPIIEPTSYYLVAKEERKVNISGLNILYAAILTTGLSGMLDSVSVLYSTGAGCIRWDDTFGLILNNCEVGAGSNDGINGHTSGDITCYSCWGHDMADDGESDHEECHIVQYGGLYEYNGNGCTPASGASGEYYNTFVRHCGDFYWVKDNGGSGFSLQSDDTSMYCNGCIASNCKIGFRETGSNAPVAVFVNCISHKNGLHFNGAECQKFNCVTIDE